MMWFKTNSEEVAKALVEQGYKYTKEGELFVFESNKELIEFVDENYPDACYAITNVTFV